MNLSSITPVILTYNEEANISRTLRCLSWADCIIVLDSGSQDRTPEICREFSNVQFHHRRFDFHAKQWNRAIALAPTNWILSLDADYQVSSELVRELQQLPEVPLPAAYKIPFLFAVRGKPIKRHLLPPRLAFFDRNKASYLQDGHTQILRVSGSIQALNSPLIHDDRKPFYRWLSNQKKYASLEAQKLANTPLHALSPQDHLRKLILPAPPAVLLYTLVCQKLLLQGPRAWLYCLQRFLAECILSVFLVSRLIQKKRTHTSGKNNKALEPIPKP